MRHLYLVRTHDHTRGHNHLFRKSAWLDNGDGTSLLSVQFHNDDHQDYFEELEGVHPLVRGQELHPDHVRSLAHLGVSKGDTTETARKKARRVYRAL